jgi:hypothetical protein
MATVMCVEASDDADADVETDAAAEAAGAELLDELLVTEQPASARAATAASGRTRRGTRPADVIFPDIPFSLWA